MQEKVKLGIPFRISGIIFLILLIIQTPVAFIILNQVRNLVLADKVVFLNSEFNLLRLFSLSLENSFSKLYKNVSTKNIDLISEIKNEYEFFKEVNTTLFEGATVVSLWGFDGRQFFFSDEHIQKYQDGILKSKESIFFLEGHEVRKVELEGNKSFGYIIDISMFMIKSIEKAGFSELSRWGFGTVEIEDGQVDYRRYESLPLKFSSEDIMDILNSIKNVSKDYNVLKTTVTNASGRYQIFTKFTTEIGTVYVINLENRFVSFVELRSGNFLVIEYDYSEEIGLLGRPMLVSIGSAGLFAIGVAFIVIILTGGLSGSLSRFRGFLAELLEKGGDLTQRFEVRTSLPEVRNLVDGMNVFLASLDEIVSKVKEVFSETLDRQVKVKEELEKISQSAKFAVAEQDEVRQMIEEATSMVGETSATIEELMRSVEHVASSVEKQFGLVEEVSSVLEEAVMTISNIARRVSKADEITSYLKSESEKGLSDTRKSIENARDISTYLESIIELVTLIKELTDKIEVLSMNARIEAAHAGEYGKGFAVVAEEMGNLAEDSMKKAEEIENVVKTAIDRIKEGLDSIEKNGEKFMKIADGIKEISLFVNEINSSMKEQSKSNELIMSNFSNLVSYSDNIRIAMTESKSGMEEITKATYEINEAITKVNESFARMYENVKLILQSISFISGDVDRISEKMKEMEGEFSKFKVSSSKKAKGMTLVE